MRPLQGHEGLVLDTQREVTVAVAALSYVVDNVRGGANLDPMLKKAEDKFVLGYPVEHFDTPIPEISVEFDAKEKATFLKVLDCTVNYHPDAKIAAATKMILGRIAKLK